jgi:hypothetical protein
MKRQVWLFILFLFLPTVSLAADLEKVENKLVIKAGEKQYRLRANAKPFQLAAINGAVLEQFVIGGELFVVVDRIGEKLLLRSKDGLGYYPVPGLTNEPILEYNRQKPLLVRTNSKVLLYVRSEFTEITEPIVGSKLDQFYLSSDQFYYLDLQAGKVTVFGWAGDVWNRLDELDCLEVTRVTALLPTVVCDGKLFQLFTSNTFNLLSSAQLSLLSSSDTLSVFVGQTDIGIVVILTPNELIELTLPISSPILFAKILGNRVFLEMENRQYELDYDRTIPELTPAPAEGGELVAVEGTSWLYFRSGSENWLTTAFGSWQPVTVAGAYDRANKLSSGVVLWKYDGADVQFSVDGLSFSLRNGAWARSAKFKELLEHNQEVFLLLLNSSLAPNLYRTTTLTSWSRVTLPTKPTHQLPVREARLALAGTLLEVSGVVTADQGLVSDEAFYLQDQTAGIQVFLSKAKGAFPNIKDRTALVTGELSSSQTKRIIIDAPDDAIIGGVAAIDPVAAATSDELQQRLGEKVVLNSTATDVESDYFTLSSQLARIKAHLTESKTYLSEGDSIQFSAIVDWNSASEAVETWVFPESVVVSRVQTTKTESPKPQPAPVKRATQPAVSKSTPAPAVVAAATKKITPIANQTSNPAPVGSIPSQHQNIITVLLSSLGLLVASNGRRFQRLLSRY